MPERRPPAPAEQQRLLASWNARRFARAALQEGAQRSTKHLLRRTSCTAEEHRPA